LFSPGSRPHTTKIGRGHTRYQSKSWAPHQVSNYLLSGATSKKIFTSIERTF
jgi:hypothetical protein